MWTDLGLDRWHPQGYLSRPARIYYVGYLICLLGIFRVRTWSGQFAPTVQIAGQVLWLMIVRSPYTVTLRSTLTRNLGAYGGYWNLMTDLVSDPNSVHWTNLHHYRCRILFVRYYSNWVPSGPTWVQDCMKISAKDEVIPRRKCKILARSCSSVHVVPVVPNKSIACAICR